MGLLADRIAPLAEAGKLGPLLWQLPESFRRDDDRLAIALRALPPGRHAFEFRHAGWFRDEVMDLLRRHGVALVVGDSPERPFQRHERTADFTYVRLHHGRRGRRGNYSETELVEWAKRVRRLTSDGGDAYVYFNNDWEAFTPRNAARLRTLLADVG